MNVSFRLHEDLFINCEVELWFILFDVFVWWYGKARLHLLSSKLHISALAEGAGRSELSTGNMMILAGFKSLQAEFLQHTKAWRRSNVAANVKCNQSAVWWVKTCRESIVADRCTCPWDAVGHQRMRRSYHCSGCMMPSLSRQTAPAIL